MSRRQRRTARTKSQRVERWSTRMARTAIRAGAGTDAEIDGYRLAFVAATDLSRDQVRAVWRSAGLVQVRGVWCATPVQQGDKP